MFIILLLIGIFTIVTDALFCEQFTKVGCHKKIGGTKYMNELLIKGRDSIDWNNYELTIARIFCNCKKIANEKGYGIIGLQYYGECWGSKLSMEKFLEHSKEYVGCVNGIYKKCSKTNRNELCMGTDISTAIYVDDLGSKKIDGGYSEWSQWTTCSATCNKGYQVRSRLCNNPTPKNRGEECYKYLGEGEKSRSCFEGPCNDVGLTSFNCNLEKGEEFYNLSTTESFKPTTPFCGVLDTETAKKKSQYTVSVDMYSVTTDIGTRMGLMFNAKDANNYEFVYIHMKSDFFCYSTGRVQKGILDWSKTQSDQCNRVFLPEHWFHFEVHVYPTRAIFKADKQKVVSWETTLENTGKGGVIVKNGWNKNDPHEVYFKDLHVY